VRDAFYLGLASDLCPLEYDPVRYAIVTDDSVATSAMKTGGGGSGDYGGPAAQKTALRRTVEAARKSPSWKDMVDAVKDRARAVGSDLDEIWMGLENGRLEWLAAASGAHKIKMTLRSALERKTEKEKEGKGKDSAVGGGDDEDVDDAPTEGDVSDAKMVWIYALCVSIPSLKEAAETWRRVVQMKDGTRPLVDYRAELWDCRRDEWRPLDLGAQAASERGGSTLEEAWKA